MAQMDMKTDPDDQFVKRYMLGGCPVLAAALGTALDLPVGVIRNVHIRQDGTRIVDPDVLHAFVVLDTEMPHACDEGDALSDRTLVLDALGVRPLAAVKLDQAILEVHDLSRRADDTCLEMEASVIGPSRSLFDEHGFERAGLADAFKAALEQDHLRKYLRTGDGYTRMVLAELEEIETYDDPDFSDEFDDFEPTFPTFR
jgi:hypothetical protein